MVDPIKGDTPWSRMEARASSDGSIFELHCEGDIAPGYLDAAGIHRGLAAAEGRPVLLLLNSPGGSFFEGISMRNALLRHAPGVDTRVTGLAASIASAVALAGRTVTMAPGSFVMIHNPWTMSVGDAAEMRRAAELLDRLRESLVEIYARRMAAKTVEEISGMLDAETWFSAEEAVTVGYADACEGLSAKIAARGVDRFKNIPAQLRTPSHDLRQRLCRVRRRRNG